MEPLELTTELDAVNAMLASIGESPLASLTDGFEDAGLARSILAQVSRQTQLRGWTFNTQTMTLTPTVTGQIALPLNVLKILPTDGTAAVLRGTKVFNPTTNTDVFSASFTAEVSYFLDWVDLPEAARLFIFMRGARRFQDRLGGDADARRILAADESSAWAALLDYEAEQARYNIFNNDQLLQRIQRNRGAPTWQR